MRFYEAAKRLLILATLAGAAAAIALVAWKVVAIGNAIETEVWQVGPRVEHQVQLQGDRTRDLVRGIAADVAGRLDGQITALRADARSQGDQIARAADTRLASIQSDAREQLTEARRAMVEQLGQANASISRIAALSDPVQRTAERIDGAAAILLDCKGNGACLPAQTLALVGSARFTMGQIARAAPESSRAFAQTSNSVAGIAGDFKTLTGKFVAPKPWYKHVGDTVLGFAGVARFFE